LKLQAPFLTPTQIRGVSTKLKKQNQKLLLLENNNKQQQGVGKQQVRKVFEEGHILHCTVVQ
jgi:hypothetical protein